MIVAIGSSNPVKIQAVRKAFGDMNNQFIEVDAKSGVSAQPFSDEETISGAVNRAKACLAMTNADVAVGLEGGVVDTSNGMFVCNWGAIADRSDHIVISGGARFLLPEEVAKGVKSGKELGLVMDEYTKKKDIRKKEGAIGIFSNGRISREGMYFHLVELLLGQYEYYDSIQPRGRDDLDKF